MPSGSCPLSQQSLQSARANYTAGKVDFLRLIDAERQFHGQRERYYEALADYQRRQAELERAVGQRALACWRNAGPRPSRASRHPASFRLRPFPVALAG